MPTCLEVAEVCLQQRSIKESTFKEYLATLRVLGLADVPYETVTLAMLNSRLSRVLTASTRRKHAINLRACLGLPAPCPKAAQKVYALPPLGRLVVETWVNGYADPMGEGDTWFVDWLDYTDWRTGGHIWGFDPDKTAPAGERDGFLIVERRVADVA